MKVYLVYRYIDAIPDVYVDRDVADAALKLLESGWNPYMDEREVLTKPSQEDL